MLPSKPTSILSRLEKVDPNSQAEVIDVFDISDQEEMVNRTK
jgi:hypothetical protein